MSLFALGRHFELLNRLMYEYFPLFKVFRVPETWLTVRPRRFYRKRMPKELNAPARPRGGTRSAR